MPNELGLPEGVSGELCRHMKSSTTIYTQKGRFLTLTEIEEWKRAVVEAKAESKAVMQDMQNVCGYVQKERDEAIARAEKTEAEGLRLREAIKTGDPIAWQEGFKDGAKFKDEMLKAVRKEVLRDVAVALRQWKYTEATSYSGRASNSDMVENCATFIDALAEKEVD